LITQVRARRSGIVQDGKQARSYEECAFEEREAMRFGALRVMQALVLLGYIEAPGDIVAP
jgi:hypothetical protein